MLFFIHPAIRLVIGGAALAAGVAVHKNLLILLGAVIVVTAAGQWLRRARGSRR